MYNERDLRLEIDTKGRTDMSNNRPENAVVLIPSLEPDERLPRYVKALLAKGFGHIVVVDDGSSEAFQPIFQQLADMPGVTVTHHEVNRGKGAALKTGYALIEKQFPDCLGVVTADADGQHTVQDVWRLAEALTSGEKKLYLGSRDFSLPHVPPRSRHGNRITSSVFKALYGQWLPDTQTGLRAFRREELPFMQEVEGDRYEYEMRVLIACARAGIPMESITIETVYENGNEGSHFHPIRDSYRIYKVILGSFVKFMGTSILCVGIDQGLAWLLRDVLLAHMGIDHTGLIWASGLLARLVSSVVNFALNRSFVFKLKGSAKSAVWKYALLCVAVICISNLCVQLLELIGWNAGIAKAVCDTLLYFFNYHIQNRWVFREEEKKA